MEFKVSKELFTSLSCDMQDSFCPNPNDPNDFSLYWEKRHESVSYLAQFHKIRSLNVKARYMEAETGKAAYSDNDNNNKQFDNSVQDWSRFFDFLSDTFTFGYFMKVPYIDDTSDETQKEMIFELQFRLSKNLVDIVGRIKLSTFGKWSYYIRPDDAIPTKNFVGEEGLKEEFITLIQQIMNYERDNNHDLTMPDLNDQIGFALKRIPYKLYYRGECQLNTEEGVEITVNYKRQLNVERCRDKSLKVKVQEYTFVKNHDDYITSNSGGYTRHVCDALEYELNDTNSGFKVNSKVLEQHVVCLAEIHRRKKQFLNDSCNKLLNNYLKDYLYGRNAVLAKRNMLKQANGKYCDPHYFLNDFCATLLTKPVVIKMLFRRPVEDGSGKRSKCIAYHFILKDESIIALSLSKFELFAYVDQRYGEIHSINNNVLFGIKLPLTDGSNEDSSGDLSSSIEDYLNSTCAKLKTALNILLESEVTPDSLNMPDPWLMKVSSQLLVFDMTPVFINHKCKYFPPEFLVKTFEKSWKVYENNGKQWKTLTKFVGRINTDTKTWHDSSWIDYAATMFNRPHYRPIYFGKLKETLKFIVSKPVADDMKASAELALFLISSREEDEISALINAAKLGNIEARNRLACGYFFNYALRSRKDMNETLLLNIFQDYPKFEIELYDKLDQGAYGAVYTATVKSETSESMDSRRWNSSELIIGHMVIAKRLKRDDLDKLRAEATCMLLLRSSHFIVKGFGQAEYNSEGFVLMELADRGSLEIGLRDLHNKLSDPWNDECMKIKLQWMLDIARGLYDLHHFHIRHLDLHARNILLFSTCTTQDLSVESTIPRAKIADFGLSRRQSNYDDKLENSDDRSSYFAGDYNQSFKAQDEVKTLKYDIFMFGKVCLKMFELSNDLEPENYSGLQRELMQFMKRLLEPIMDKRINATDCVISLTRLIKKYPLEEKYIASVFN